MTRADPHPIHADIRSAWPRRRVGTLFVLVAVAVCAAGYLLPRYGVRLGAPSPPFYGFFHPVLTPWLAASAAGLGLLVLAAAKLAAAPGRWFLALSAPLALSAQITVNVTRHGPGELARPLTGRIGENDALASLHLFTRHPVGFLEQFASRVHDLGLPIHVMGHPPGSTVLLGGLSAVGLAGPWPAVAAILAIGALAAPLVTLLGRELADERSARMATLAWVFAPSVLLENATSFDAVYATAGLATALQVVRHRRAAATAGAIACSFLSYALLGAIVWALLIVAAHGHPRRAARLAGWMLAGVVASSIVLYVATGYDPIAAFRATSYAYAHGVSRHRPNWYWVVGDLVAFFVALGPAVALAFADQLSGRSRTAVVTMAVLSIAALGGFSKAEVERIWLFAVPFVAVAAAPRLRDAEPRLLLAGLALQALAVEVAVGTTW